MPRCIDCLLESDNSKGWLAELTEEDRIMRCPDCGVKEENKRWDQRYPYKKRPESFEDVPKENRIAHARALRELGLSAWTFRKEEG